MSAWMNRGVAILGACCAVAGGGLLAAPVAYAESPALPASITDAIAKDGLKVEVSNGWEAVTGPARSVNDVRSLSESLGVSNIVAYTGNDETGQAILIFTGDDTSAARFDITGGVISSVDNDTDQPWYVYDDQGTYDDTVTPGEERNISPADAELTNVAIYNFGYGAVFTF